MGIFALFILPGVKGRIVFSQINEAAASGWAQALAVFSFFCILVALLSALTALPVNRILEGYTWPDGLSRHFRRRQVLRARRLKASFDRDVKAGRLTNAGQAYEKLYLYPRRTVDILPTRLGNAYKAIETYGSDSFNLDIQALNYELFSVGSERLRQDCDDTRAQVDFFLGFTFLLACLSLTAVGTAAASDSPISNLVVAITAILLSRLSYLAAIKNMLDLAMSMQALVNVGRGPLASALGYELPSSLAAERRLWAAWSTASHTRSSSALARLDDQRASKSGQSPTPPSSSSRFEKSVRAISGRRAANR